MATKKLEPSKDTEPRRKLFRLVLTVEFEGTSIAEARQKAAAELKKQAAAISPAEMVFQVVRKGYASRALRLQQAMDRATEAKGDIEGLKEELEEWYGNLPESFQNGDKGEALQEAISQLEQVEQALDEADGAAQDVNFPGMY